MADSSEDADRILVRSKWGTNRYAHHRHNPVGRALIVGSLLFAAGGMYLLHRPGLLGGSGGWDGDDLRSAVQSASSELSRDAQFGPGTMNYEEILRAGIAQHGHGPRDALTVRLSSQRPKSAVSNGDTEQADYTVTAEGTDTAFCLHVRATKRKPTIGYDAVTVSVREGACPAS
ncbi:hypothetical protein ABT173_15840 [Streptomyces sp. NPDC001795]|uniref:hypothetical protein n=1 Tax=unclassified Streptomyces TaxID=2593676 RepID=UPI00331D7625